MTFESDSEAQAYTDQVEPGLGTWLEAGFAPPVTYAGKTAIIPRTNPVELVIGALPRTGRPVLSLPDFEPIHGNLSRAFPEVAETARARNAAGASA